MMDRPSADPQELDGVAAYLEGELVSGRLHLFTGAGFSADAEDCRGNLVPTGPELARDLWPLCFPGEPWDEASSLEDLFYVASAHNPEALRELLQRRLSIDPASLAPWHATYFELPWRRVYTVNVDDIERAIAKRFAVRRAIRVISALDSAAECARTPHPAELEVVHLNGLVEDGLGGVTFSTPQYGSRLAHTDSCYQRLAEDLEGYPFLFVGTTLIESPLWQHVARKQLAERPQSFVVARHLSRARQRLLEGLHIHWIPATAAAFAEEVLEPIRRALPREEADSADRPGCADCSRRSHRAHRAHQAD